VRPSTFKTWISASGRTTLRSLVGATLLAVAAVSTPVTTADAAAGTDRLLANEQLNPDQRLTTTNGIAVVMQGDGNLVEYAPGNRAIWASGTNRPGSIVRMQSDGNVVIIAPGNVPVWSTGTGGNPGAGLELQTDGNLVVYGTGHVARWANGASVSAPPSASREIAATIRGNANVTLQTVHVSGVRDNAHTLQNIVDTANGGQAARSNYGGAPGGRVSLDARMLRALQQLGSEGRLRVSEIAGGSHSSGSRHYAGRAFDIDQYGGRSTSTLVNRCRQLGASLAQFETTHVHCEWPA
jgi:hypothetical protein